MLTQKAGVFGRSTAFLAVKRFNVASQTFQELSSRSDEVDAKKYTRMQHSIQLIVIALLANEAAAKVIVPGIPFLLSSNLPKEMPKIVGDWTGCSTDFASGGAIGAACGYVVGKLTRATLSITIAATIRAAMIAAPILSLLSASVSIISLLARFQLVTIHWEKIHAIARAVLPQRLIPTDVQTLLPEGSVQHDLATKAEEGVQHVRVLAAGNKHLTVGATAGFCVGLAKGLKVSDALPKKAATFAIPSTPQEVLDLPFTDILAKLGRVGAAAVRGAVTAGSEESSK